MKTHNGWVIPGAELRPLILEWAKRNGYEQSADYHGTNHQSDRSRVPITLYQVLEHRSGVPHRRISGILNGTNASPNLSFDTADKLLCAMDMVHEWHDRLASYYEEPIEVSADEARRLNEKERAMRDLRDPTIVGQKLLDLCEQQQEIQPSVLADLNGLPAPDWTGDGFMSSNPAEHHSKVSQVDNERIKARA